jgi:hypothetical protein
LAIGYWYKVIKINDFDKTVMVSARIILVEGLETQNQFFSHLLFIYIYVSVKKNSEFLTVAYITYFAFEKHGFWVIFVHYFFSMFRCGFM